jgi:hypothetical protein
MLESPVESQIHISGTIHSNSSDVADDTAGSSPDHMILRKALSAVLVNVPPVLQVTEVKSTPVLPESCCAGVTAVPPDRALILRSVIEVMTPVTPVVWLFRHHTRYILTFLVACALKSPSKDLLEAKAIPIADAVYVLAIVFFPYS